MLKRYFLLIIIMLIPYRVSASNLDVPLQDPAYRALDELVACNFIHSIHYGQRPFSHSEFTRLLDEAAQILADYGSDDMISDDDACLRRGKHIIAQIRKKLAVSSGRMPLPKSAVQLPYPVVRIEGSGAINPGSATISRNGLGSIALQAHPLNVFREGFDIPAEGAGLFLEIYQPMSISKWFSFAVRQRGWLEFGTNDNTASARGKLREALITLSVKNLDLSIGRGRVIWGPARHGGLLLTDHAPPLDMVRIRTPHPFRIPGIFRRIGTIKTSLLFVSLGSRYTPAGTILSGYRFDIQPHPWVTFGLNHLVMLGGSGMTGPTAGEAIREFAGFVQSGHGNATSNHELGFDLHLRIPPWRGTQIYASYAIEDPDSELEIQFDKQAAWLFGFSLPRLTADGRWKLRFEYWRAGAGMYRHRLYRDGWTLQGHGLGNPFGGDSNSAELTLTWTKLLDHTLDWRVGVVQRSSNTYRDVTDGAGDRIAIIKVIDGPEEITAYTSVQAQIPLRKNLSGAFSFGYAHSWNSQFTAGKHQNNATAEVVFQWRTGMLE